MKKNTEKNIEDALPPGLKEMWDMAGNISFNDPVSEQDTEHALSSVLEQISPDPKNAPVHRLVVRMAVAATILLTALTGYLSLYEYTYTAPAGERQLVTLADGSSLWLNGNSQISHKPLFGIMHRNLTMSGEVYFEVAKDPEPFIIEAPHLTTTVLGTSFSVRDWEMAEYINPAVMVAEGRVSVSDDESQSFILNRSDMVMMDLASSRMSSSTANIDDMDWRESGFIFHSTPLPEFFERLQHHFNTPITVDPDLKEQRIEAHYRPGKTLDQILSDVSVVKDLYVIKTNNGYMIRP